MRYNSIIKEIKCSEAQRKTLSTCFDNFKCYNIKKGVFKMKEKIFEVNGINYKVIEIEKGAIYELQRQKENGMFYKVSIDYAKKYKIKVGIDSMKTLKVKEILDMTSEELRKMMSGDQIGRMLDMGIEHVWKLLEFLQDGVRAAQESSDLKDDDYYVTIDEYLDYLEEMSSED